MIELKATNSYRYDGLILYTVKPLNLINRTRAELYFDISSLAQCVQMPTDMLIQFIHYDSTTKSYLAYFRDEDYIAVSIYEVAGIDDLFRALRLFGIDIKEPKERVYKMLKIIQKEGMIT